MEIPDPMNVLKWSLREAGQRRHRGGAAPDLEDQTKEQLYERARELDIEGRSAMTKQEPIEALRRVA